VHTKERRTQKGEAFVLQFFLSHRGVVGSKFIHISRNLFHRRGHAAIFWHGQDLKCDLGRKIGRLLAHEFSSDVRVAG
jgi:hypothetical protein